MSTVKGNSIVLTIQHLKPTLKLQMLNISSISGELCNLCVLLKKLTKKTFEMEQKCNSFSLKNTGIGFIMKVI